MLTIVLSLIFKSNNMRGQFLILLSCILFGLISCQTELSESKNQASSARTGKPNSVATVEDIEREIRQHIQKITDREGTFTLQTDSQALALQLVRVHTEYLSVLGPDEFFACVDLATPDGDVYDVDFFLKGTKDSMTVTQKSVHKINGKPFYTWKQKPDGSWTTVRMGSASRELLGVKEGSDSFQFTTTCILPDWQGQAHLWIPIASSDTFQEVHSVTMNIPFPYKKKTEARFGNTYIYAKVDDEYAGDTINIDYRVTRKEKSAYPGNDLKAQRFLGATPFLPVGGQFQQLAEQIIFERAAQSPLAKARALYDYISDSLRYAKEGTYGTADAQYACDAKSGNCTEFHSLFISLARSVSIPARFAVGAAIPTARNEGGITGYHCWAEFYAEKKWWPIDISEANKYAALSTYYFGHHPANRIEISRGRQIAVDPAPSEGALTFFVYPLMEQGGEELFPTTRFSFQRKPQ
jgi:hypothetical protein